MAVSFGRRGGVGAAKKVQPASTSKAGRSRAFQAMLDEERERECRAEAASRAPVQKISDGRPKVYLEVAVFRGSFFGVDYQDVLEFELCPEVAPRATQRFLEDCAAGRLRELAFGRITEEAAALPEPAAHVEPETGRGWSHDAAGMLSAARSDGGPGTLLTLQAAPQLDKKRAAFGKLLRGKGMLQRIADCRPIGGVAVKEVRIVGCGEALGHVASARSHSARSESERSSSRGRNAGHHRNPSRSRSRNRRQ
mmetsp:Transcript_108140/g.304572  ORF Transcript_108140/g.304572 Transcript_108140/m.304572 type:complete len:252 (-) Transcript_108140:49-804(-)